MQSAHITVEAAVVAVLSSRYSKDEDLMELLPSTLARSLYQKVTIQLQLT